MDADVFERENLEKRSKWDRRFLKLAEEVAGWSKDPSTKTGAVIVDSFNRVISTGFNGFPRGVADLPARYQDRVTKLNLIVHCEMNAILFAKTDLRGSTLYTWPFMSCVRCAVHVIQTGIWRCVAPETPADKAARWADDMKAAREMFKEAGVYLDILA